MDQNISSSAEPPAEAALNEGTGPSSLGVQFMFLAGLVISVALFLFASRTFHVPTFPGLGGSLLAEPGALLAFGVIAAALLLCVLVGTGIAGWMRFDAGLFCAAGGMAALSWRAGTVGDVLRQAGPGGSTFIFIILALELSVLFALLGLGWSMLWWMHRQGWVKSEEIEDALEAESESVGMKWAALGIQAAVMAVIIMILGQSDTKVQAQFSVGVAAFIATWAACAIYPIGPSAWFWVGPLIVGVVGYVAAYFGTAPADDVWKTGQITSALAPLARALPLDYATAGPVGALLAYWLVRKKSQPNTEWTPTPTDHIAV